MKILLVLALFYPLGECSPETWDSGLHSSDAEPTQVALGRLLQLFPELLKRLTSTPSQTEEETRILGLNLNLSSVTSPFGVIGLVTFTLLVCVPLFLLFLYVALVVIYPDPYSEVKFERDVALVTMYVENLASKMEDKVFDFLEEITDPGTPQYQYHLPQPDIKDHHAKPSISSYQNNHHHHQPPYYDNIRKTFSDHHTSAASNGETNLRITETPHPVQNVNNHYTTPPISISSYQDNPHYQIPHYDNTRETFDGPHASGTSKVETNLHGISRPHPAQNLSPQKRWQGTLPTKQEESLTESQKKNIYTEVANIYVTQMAWNNSKTGMDSGIAGSYPNSQYIHAFSSKDDSLSQPQTHFINVQQPLGNKLEANREMQSVHDSRPVMTPSISLGSSEANHSWQPFVPQSEETKTFNNNFNSIQTGNFKFKSKLFKRLLQESQ